MDGGPTDIALTRIETAIARIERAAAQPVPADAALRERHERLREAVSQSLRQLDELLARQES